MGWTERQRRMLQVMGLRVWAPAAPAALPTAAELDGPASPALPVAAADPVGAPAARTGDRTVERPAPVASPVARPVSPPVSPPVVAPAVRAAEPQDSAVAGLDWPALRAAVAECRACSLCETRKQTVFGVGHEQAHWMIVGEAPGEQEDLQGEPFVGPAGQLLDAMLRAVGRSRAEGDAAARVYIANTLKCRPPRNRNPEPEELARCEAFLQRQIALVQPKLILAMGKFAIQQLTGSADPVGRLRGRVHLYQGVPVVVTYHPAYLLRQLTEKAKAWDDLRLALRVYDKVLAREADQAEGR